MTGPTGELRFSRTHPLLLRVTTLARQVGETAHYSLLLRKARGLGLDELPALMCLAVARGARHYASVHPPADSDPGVAALSHEELVVLLVLGSHPFDPFAVRCAAQLLSRCDFHRLGRLARQERVERVLGHIARAGITHDEAHADRWRELLESLGHPAPVAPGRLPHWSRFVSQSGVTRQGGSRVDWLHARP